MWRLLTRRRATQYVHSTYIAVVLLLYSIMMCGFLQARAVGVIPYLGTFLTDLTMTHTAFPDTLHVREH